MYYPDILQRVAPQSIDYHHKKASQLAIKKTKELALKILKDNPGLKEFVMAMGTYFFVDKNGETVNCIESQYTKNGYRWKITKRYFIPLVKHIDKWEDTYKITGYAIRFTKNGKVTKEW